LFLLPRGECFRRRSSLVLAERENSIILFLPFFLRMDCSYREKRERRKRGGKEREEGLFFSLFLPFLDDRLLIFFSRALFFSALD